MNQLYAQLYSVKDYMEKDYMGTLAAIAKMGYVGVEFAGYANYSAVEIKSKLDELSLEALSSHISLERLTHNLKEEIAFSKVLGAKFIICPYAEIKTVESALAHADIFNEIGEQCKKEGIVFAYHNHDHELVLEDGHYPLEVLFETVKPEFVQQQPDLYWVAYAGLDPLTYIKTNKDRCPIIHLKQMKDMINKLNVEAGQGFIDFEAIKLEANDAYFVYEQEFFEETSLVAMANSIEFLLHSGK